MIDLLIGEGTGQMGCGGSVPFYIAIMNHECITYLEQLTKLKRISASIPTLCR